MRFLCILALNLSLFLCTGFHPLSAEASSLGKGARIFIDKAHPAHSDLTKEDFKQIADAGFTVVAQKWKTDLSGKKLIPLETYARRAAVTNLAVITFEMGLVNATDDVDRTVTSRGRGTRYTRPQSARAWQELTERMVGYARLAKELPNIKGVALDFEIYDGNGNNANGFCESYDDESFHEFFTSIGRDAPQPLPAAEQRQQYLMQRGMYQLYLGRQIDEVAKKARGLRQAVDSVNPDFQFGIYGWGVMVAPLIHELATSQAPVLVLDALTYGRSLFSNAFAGGYDGNRPDKEALQWSLDTVKKGVAETHYRYDNAVFLAGHYVHAPGPEDGMQFKFTAKQAFESAAFGEGYWIWSDWITPKPWTNRREWYDAMLQYFKEAHIALASGELDWAKNQPDTVK